MTATRNNLRVATAALSGAAIILLASILLAIRPVPAFAEGGQVVLNMPTDVPCAVKADGSVVAPSPEAWTINNTSGAPVIIGGVTITPGKDAGPIGMSASATPYNGNAACGDPFDWFSYGRGQDADRPSAEQTLEAGDSLQVAWSIDKLDSVNNRKAIDGSTNADGFAFANIQFSFKKKGPEAFAVFYDDGNGGRAAKLYKRYDVPAIGDVFEGDTVTEVITDIENMPNPFNEWEAPKKMTAVAVVDDGIQPLTMNRWFSNCRSLVSADLGKLDPSKTEDMSSMFYNCSSLTELDLSGWNADPSEGSQTVKSTKNVKDMGGMFNHCTQLVRLNIPNWKTDGVTNMSGMFLECESLENLDVSNWNTEKVTNLVNMFCNCYKLDSLDLSKWNTGKVTDMWAMFMGCRSITSLDMSNWDLSEMQRVESAFHGCSSLVSLDLSNWNFEKCEYVGHVFSGCSALRELNVSDWSTGNVKGFGSLFYDCKSLTAIDVSKWDISKASDMSGMFSGCSSLTSISFPDRGVSTETASGVQGFGGMFRNCSSLTTVDLSGVVSLSSTSSSDIDGMFNGCNELKQVTLREQWPYEFSKCSLPATMYVKDVNGSFAEYTGGFPTPKTDTYYTEKGIKQAFAVFYDDGNGGRAAKLYKRAKVPAAGDVFEGDTVTEVITGIENMSGAFKDNGGKKLTAVTVVDDGIQPLTMERWFLSCTKLEKVNLLKLDTSKVTDMSRLFARCQNLKSLDLSRWDTSSVTNMSSMFFDTDIETLPFEKWEKWDVSKVTDMNGMFYQCGNLKSLDLSRWDTSSVKNAGSVFESCDSLKQVTLREGWRFSFADCSLPATMYVKDDNGTYTEYTGGFPTPKTDTYYTEKLTPKAFAVIYHDGNNQKAAKLYKRGGVPKPGDIFDGVKVDAVKESIEESEDLFAESSSESDRLTSVGVADDGIQPLNMSGWFNGCSNLVNVDLGRLDTSKVSNMGYLFDGCGSLTSDGVSGISNWNTGNVTNMANVFNGCLSLTSLDLSKWNTEKVRIIGAAFATCKNLTSLDLSGWNTKVMSSSGFSTSRVFEDCNKLDSITLGQNWKLNLYECGISTSVKFYDRDTGEVYNPKNAITKTVVYTTIKPATVSQSSIDQLEKDAAPADVSSGVAPRKSVDVELISDQASNAVVNDDASSVVMPSSEDARHVGDAWVEGSDSGLPAENTDVVDTDDRDDRHKAIEAGLK